MAKQTDSRIGALAETQYGVLSRKQLLERGLTRNEIQGRLDSGVLTSIHTGVYSFGHAELTPNGRWKAATLTGETAVLSHRSAAALWGIGTPVLPIEIVRTDHHGSIRGLQVRRTRHLSDDEWTERFGIPVTTVERTLIDMAGTCDDRILGDAFSAALRLKKLDMRLLARMLDERPRKGADRLRALIERFSQSKIPRSELESRFLGFCLKSELPRPRVDKFRENRYLDFVWDEERVIAEVDSKRFHFDRFDEDRIRDLDHLADDLETVRITHYMLEEIPERVAVKIHAVLVRRRKGGRRSRPG